MQPTKQKGKRTHAETQRSSDNKNQCTTLDSEDSTKVISEEDECEEDDEDETKCAGIASPETMINKETIDQHDIHIPEFVGSPEAKPSNYQDFVRQQQEFWNRVKGKKIEIETTIQMVEKVFKTMCKTRTLMMRPKMLSFETEKDNKESDESNDEKEDKTEKRKWKNKKKKLKKEKS